MADDQKWVEVQKKTFTRWANTHLVERGAETTIKDIQYDLEDGLRLIALLELITAGAPEKNRFKVRYNKTPKIIQQKLENLNYCLQFLAKEGIKLVGIGAEDLAQGHNLKLILGLIWTIILRYHIQKGREESAKNALLEWVRSKIPEYDVRDFTRSWENGMALCALVNALEPGLIDMSQRDPSRALDNATVGEDTAERDMQIPKVLLPEDMVAATDELSCMTYISYFRDYDEKKRKAMSARDAELAAMRLERTPDASKCSLSGPGLQGGEVNIPGDFVVTARNAAGRPLPQDGPEEVRVPITIDVDITAPDGTKVPATVTDNQNSTYGVTYVPIVDGKHKVTVAINGAVINPQPIVVPILPPTPDPSKCTAHGPGVEGAEAGDAVPFMIQARNRIGDPIHVGGHPFKSEVKDPFGNPVPVTLTDNGDGTYAGTFEPAPGEHTNMITVGGRPIAGSPYHPNFSADARAAFAGTSYAFGPGVEGPANTFDPSVFTVQAVNPAGEKITRGGDKFSADVENAVTGVEVPVELVDNGDGTYTGTYRAPEPGNHLVHVKLHHPKNQLYYAHIKDSPYRVAIEPGLDPRKCLCFGPGLGDDVLDNKPTTFTVQARDCLGRDMKQGGLPIEVAVAGPDGKEVPADVKDNGDGTYTVQYEPDKAGDTQVKVGVKDSAGNESPIGESPYHVNVHAGADYHHTGIGQFTFTIQARNKAGEIHKRGGEKIEVGIVTPSGANVEGIKVADAGDGTYMVSYTLPPESGQFKVSVQLNGHDIKGTPFNQVMA